MEEQRKDNQLRAGSCFLTLLAFLLLPLIWICLKYFAQISDRYLPAPLAVLQATTEIEPSVWLHLAYTALRLVLGFLAGVTVGIVLGIAIFKSKVLAQVVTPMLDSMRSVPAIAIVPFFLLWFGFSEVGRLLLIVTGIAFNIAIATAQALADIPEKYEILFKSFGIPASALTCQYVIPRVLETLLPTVRFSLSTAMGVVIASELLGSQIGLGYLMQTARSTFSMHIIFLSTILLGLLNAAVDATVTRLWLRSIYWR